MLSANLHDGSVLVNYPYDDGNTNNLVSHTPDHEIFVRLAYSYARSHAYMWKKVLSIVLHLLFFYSVSPSNVMALMCAIYPVTSIILMRICTLFWFDGTIALIGCKQSHICYS